jgi:hypothetical protein
LTPINEGQFGARFQQAANQKLQKRINGFR